MKKQNRIFSSVVANNILLGNIILPVSATIDEMQNIENIDSNENTEVVYIEPPMASAMGGSMHFYYY